MKSLCALIVEDLPSDAELMLHELRRQGYRVQAERVDNERDFLARLDPGVDVIISDYRMPSFSGPRALELLKERGLDIPFIIVTGAVGEEQAVECLHQGAADYLLKDRLGRLGQAIERALEEKRLRDEKRRTDAALSESEERFQRLAQTARDLVYRYQLLPARAQGYTYVSPSAEAITGYSEEEFYSRADLRTALVHPDDLVRFVAHNKTVGKGKKPLEVRWVRKDGTVIWVEVREVAVRGEGGAVVAFEGAARDVTERMRAAEALRRSEELYRGLVEASGAVVVRVDRRGRRTFAVGRPRALDRRTDEEFLKGRFGDNLTEEDREKAWATLEEVFTTGKPVAQFMAGIVNSRGESRYLTSNWQPIFDASGKVAEVQITWFDITEHRRLQEQYFQSQKMESIGTMAGGIAHDFNNILTVILNDVSMALRASPDLPQLKMYLSEIKDAGDRATSLTRQLLAFSRRQVAQPKPTDLNRLVNRVEKLARRLVPENVQMEVRPAAGLWPVKVDGNQIEQVVMNLVTNARDAMPRGGALTIRTANVSAGPDEADAPPTLPPGEYASIAITDTGVGISQEAKAHLFEPFFTTKPHGTGLGLAACYTIVNQNGGQISVESELNKGTTVVVYLPRCAQSPAAESEDDGVMPTGTETILLAEDEPLVRISAARTLRQLGYQVYDASDGGEALQLSKIHEGEKIQLLLSDLIMPHIGGDELAELLKTSRPSTRVLLTSGHADVTLGRLSKLERHYPFLEKPFSPESLAKKVREVLDAQPAAG